jgi:hypothetical protein
MIFRFKYGIRTVDSPLVPLAQTHWFLEGLLTQVGNRLVNPNILPVSEYVAFLDVYRLFPSNSQNPFRAIVSLAVCVFYYGWCGCGGDFS